MIMAKGYAVLRELPERWRVMFGNKIGAHSIPDNDYDMSIIGHAEPWDINNYANPNYYYRWDNAEFRRVFRESEVTVDDKKRRELYATLQKMLAEEAPAVWLYMHPRLVVTKKGVTGIWKDLPIPALDLSEVAWQK